MKSSGASVAIKVAVLGQWVPSQLAEVLALQRVEEPETKASLIGCSTSSTRAQDLSSEQFDFALSTAAWEWPGWTCEPVWHDTLAVAVAKRSHLLAYREVPCKEVLKQPVVCSRSTDDDPWRAVLRQLFGDSLQQNQKTVATFDVAMTLVSAGYGIALAPANRLADYAQRGIAARPLAGAPLVALAYLLHRSTTLSGPQARFAQRVHSVP